MKLNYLLKNVFGFDLPIQSLKQYFKDLQRSKIAIIKNNNNK